MIQHAVSSFLPIMRCPAEIAFLFKMEGNWQWLHKHNSYSSTEIGSVTLWSHSWELVEKHQPDVSNTPVSSSCEIFHAAFPFWQSIYIWHGTFSANSKVGKWNTNTGRHKDYTRWALVGGDAVRATCVTATPFTCTNPYKSSSPPPPNKLNIIMAQLALFSPLSSLSLFLLKRTNWALLSHHLPSCAWSTLKLTQLEFC